MSFIAAAGLCFVSTPAYADEVPPPNEDRCDDVWDWLYAESDSYSFAGRTVKLYTGRGDTAAYAFTSDFEEGDTLWVERSLNTFEMPEGDKPGHPDDDEVWARNQCDPFTIDIEQGQAWTDNVALYAYDDRGYAVRACLQPNDEDHGECTRWFVDHED